MKKTIKMYINGKFARSESGRTYPVKMNDQLYEVCLASRKDLRSSVQGGIKALPGWSSSTPYLRSQMLYRVAEVISSYDSDQLEAKEQIAQIFLHYCGWCDKFQQSLGSINPVSAPYHNFSTLVPVGHVFLFAHDIRLPQVCHYIAAIISGGNTVSVLLDGDLGGFSNILGEIFLTSDIPGGCVQVLSGDAKEMLKVAASHREVSSICYPLISNKQQQIQFELDQLGADNMKRVVCPQATKKLVDFSNQSLTMIGQFQEVKTVWHPIGT